MTVGDNLGTDPVPSDATPEPELPADVAVAQVAAATPNEADVASARELVTTLFAIAGIQKVICVDDNFSGTLEDLLSAAGTLATTEMASQFLDRFDLTEPADVWRAEIGEYWDGVSRTEQHALVARAQKQAGHADEETQLDASAIQALLPQNVEFEALSPEDWGSAAAGAVAGGALKKTLVLFDRSMGESYDEGLRLSERLFMDDAAGNLWVGLLTRTVDKGDEHAEWQRLTTDNDQLDRERFVILSKEHLGPKPETFPQAIKVLLMTKPAIQLRHLVSKAISESSVSAHETLDKLSPQEFERMIFGTSIEEGVWEPDTLLRVFQIFMRKGVRAFLYNSADIQRQATEIRELSSVATHTASDSTQALATYHAELYEDAEHLNKVHLPIELGDIFEVPDGKRFVLVEQPCDLMIRSRGVRLPEMYDALLLPIKFEPTQNPTLCYELPAFDNDGKTAWVHLNRPVMVPMAAVDLCVYSADGRAVFVNGQALTSPVWPAWLKRYEKLSSELQKLLSKVAQVDQLKAKSQINQDLRNQLISNLLRTDSASGRVIRGSASGASLTYSLRRVGRVLPMRAHSLLARYSAVHSRDAFDHALALAD